MVGNAKDAWNEVGERFASWGRMVGDRYREADASASEGAASMSEGAKEAQRKLEEAARELSDQLNRAFTALGDTLRDPKAKEDLKDAVRAIGEASRSPSRRRATRSAGGSPAPGRTRRPTTVPARTRATGRRAREAPPPDARRPERPAPQHLSGLRADECFLIVGRFPAV